MVKVGIFRTKVDEKMDTGIPTQLSDKSGCPVEPFFPAAESGP